jgi:hypothetical protein
LERGARAAGMLLDRPVGHMGTSSSSASKTRQATVQMTSQAWRRRSRQPPRRWGRRGVRPAERPTPGQTRLGGLVEVEPGVHGGASAGDHAQVSLRSDAPGPASSTRAVEAKTRSVDLRIVVGDRARHDLASLRGQQGALRRLRNLDDQDVRSPDPEGFGQPAFGVLDVGRGFGTREDEMELRVRPLAFQGDQLERVLSDLLDLPALERALPSEDLDENALVLGGGVDLNPRGRR